MTTRHMIDPPSGWKYGFPKEIPDDVEDTIAWLLENGYPQHEIDACGDHFHCRHYNEEDEVDRLKAIASKAIREQIPMRVEIERLQADKDRLQGAALAFTSGNAKLIAENAKLRETNNRYHECLQDARDFIATTLAGIGDGHRIAELVHDFDYLLGEKE